MIIVGKRYQVICEGIIHEYNRRGEYGGTGHYWDGVVRIQTRRGKFVSIFRLRVEVSSVDRFRVAHLFARSEGGRHYEEFVEALPGKDVELTDYIAELLVSRAQEREYDEPLACVSWSGLSREQAVRLGFVADRSGQIMLGVGV